jgi:ubiquinone/menaquinone biosynthesis C-methylase UbiE
LNPAGIEFCQKRHNLPGLDFVHGDAEDLPFADQSFDAVVNVEASHLYPHFPRFLAEVARVLAPGGHFLYADFRRRHGLAEWEAALADASMRLLSSAVIDAEVLRGNEKNAPRKHDLISRHGPAMPRGFARYASDVTDWAFNGALQRGEFTYRAYCFAKD